MRTHLLLGLMAIVAASLLLQRSEDSVHACAPVYPKGVHVHIAEESAVIIWDAESKIQHFIRRATFSTPTKDFGFLVPTPSQPKLEESKDHMALDQMVKNLSKYASNPPYIPKRNH